MAEIAKEAFHDYQTKSDLCEVIRKTYGRAVRSGFVGHAGRWRDEILKAGNMAVEDFADAPGQD